MRRILDRLTEEHDELQSEYTQLRASRAELNGQLLAVKDELSTRQNELQAALSSIENLNKTIAALTSERDGLLARVDDLGVEIVSLKDSMSASENDYANELAGSRQEFLDQTRALESEIATRDQQVALLEEQLAAVNTEYKDATEQSADEVVARDEMIASLQDKVAGLESARDQLRIEQQGNADEIARLLADIDELTENRTASMEKIDQLNLLNEELNAGVLSSTNAMESLKADGEAQLAKLKADIRDLSNTRDDYAAKIAQLEKLNQELADRLKSNRDKLELVTLQSNEELNSLNGTLAGFQSRESLFKSNALEAADKLTELSQRNQQLMSELDKTRGMFAQTESELGMANTEIGVFEAELNVANQKLRDLMNAQNLAEAERDRIAAEAEQLRVSLTEELNDAKLENIVVQNARADNSIPIQLGTADFFETGSARLTKKGGKNLAKLAEIIHTYHNKRIVVEGHTDTVPIGPGLQFRYASNWELSVARAAAAVRHMQKKTDIDPRSMSASGYGEFKPIADNSTEEGRRQNRRVEVVLYPSNAEFQNITALDE
jgi:chemotaxis protein MotB